MQFSVSFGFSLCLSLCVYVWFLFDFEFHYNILSVESEIWYDAFDSNIPIPMQYQLQSIYVMVYVRSVKSIQAFQCNHQSESWAIVKPIDKQRRKCLVVGRNIEEKNGDKINANSLNFGSI